MLNLVLHAAVERSLRFVFPAILEVRGSTVDQNYNSPVRVRATCLRAVSPSCWSGC